jgi:hypothetical protein
VTRWRNRAFAADATIAAFYGSCFSGGAPIPLARQKIRAEGDIQWPWTTHGLVSPKTGTVGFMTLFDTGGRFFRP